MSADRKAYMRAYYLKNKARIAEQQRVYRSENVDRIQERQAAWRDANRDRIRENTKRAYASDPGRAHEAARRWKQRNPWWVRIQNHRTRARRHGVMQVHFSLAEFLARCDYVGWRCWMCGTESDLTIDHVKPFREGGAHMLSNIRLACRTCNKRKGSRWPGVSHLPELNKSVTAAYNATLSHR